jgi:hypothetical protein
MPYDLLLAHSGDEWRCVLHSIVLNHAFHNGNKRTGLVALLAAEPSVWRGSMGRGRSLVGGSTRLRAKTQRGDAAE